MDKILYQKSSLFIFFLVTAICIQLSCSSYPEPYNEHKRVYIKKDSSGYALIKNEKPFYVKGASGFSNIHKLSEAGGNTIRTWDTVNLSTILDSAELFGISVIVGFPMVKSLYVEEFYDDEKKVSQQCSAFKNVVEKYKNHPALLAWCLGNELDFPFKPAYSSFYDCFNKLIKMIHISDPNHPVTTTLVNFERRPIINLRLKVSDLDFISINTFGQAKTLKQDLDNFAWFWDGPFLITEWGINGPWEEECTYWGAPIENTSSHKAELYSELYTKYLNFEDGRCLGSCVFFWGAKQERTHTWFNLFSHDGFASESVEIMQGLWTGKQSLNRAPQIKYMLLDYKGAKDNIVLDAGTEHFADIYFKQFNASSLSLKWEIIPEDHHSKFWENTVKPEDLNELILNAEEGHIRFKAPEKEGPYRLFLEAYDTNGFYATTNTPFYVIGKQ